MTGASDGDGPEGFYPFFDRMHAACSDIHIKVEQTIVENDLVCVRWFSTMKHTGDGLRMAPTRKTLETTGISIMRVAGGKPAEGWQYWDMLGLIQQIQETGAASALYV
jgi:C-1 hydroxylase